jgi:hypothetical protein
MEINFFEELDCLHPGPLLGRKQQPCPSFPLFVLGFAVFHFRGWRGWFNLCSTKGSKISELLLLSRLELRR